MENRCDLCGCKTDFLDLSEFVFDNGTKASVCGYCQKQLSAFNKSPKAAADWAQKLLVTDTKGVRPQKVEKAFTEMLLKNGINPPRQEPPPTSGYYGIEPSGQNYNKAEMPAFFENPATPEDELQTVKRQLGELQSEFKKFKKRYYISKILGIVLPILFVIIMVIILFASGAVQNIFDYYAQMSDLANM